MSSIDRLLLGSIKQYAKSLQDRYDHSLSKAQWITARANGFSDWHELLTVIKKSPFDDRAKGAAVSARSPAALNTPGAIAAAARAGEALGELLGVSRDEGIHANLSARGLEDYGMPEPDYHIDVESVHLTAEAPPYDRLKLNLFDPSPRAVGIYGMSGWGKSVMGLAIAVSHLSAKGNVCILDTNYCVPDSSDMLASRILRRLLESERAAIQDIDVKCDLAPFKQTTVLACGRVPLEGLLEKVWEQLLPMSILIIDGADAFPLEAGKEVLAHAIDQIIADGHAVIWIAQDLGLADALPLSDATKRNQVAMIGRLSAGGGVRYLPPVFASLVTSLPMVKDTFNGWAALISNSSGGQVFGVKLYARSIEEALAKSF